MATMDELKRAQNDAWMALEAARKALQDALTFERSQFEAQLKEKHAAEFANVRALEAAYNKAFAATEAQRVEEAKAKATRTLNNGVVLKNGDRVMRFRTRYHGGSEGVMLRGLVQVWQAADRQRYAGRTSMMTSGELFIVLYKKDGTLGQKMERISSYDDWKVATD